MAGSRGTFRNSKKLPPPLQRATEEELEGIESLASLTDKKVEALEHDAITYLERELRILTSSPGNFAEVARVLKILKEHKSKGDSVRAKATHKARAWSLAD